MVRCVRLASLSLLVWCAGSHKLQDLIKPIGTRHSAERQRVLLFLHVPKCAGTTIRGIFGRQQWKATYWSLTQRFEGWKANRILFAIRNFLASGETRIFVEWHLGINISSVPQLGEAVRTMRPSVEFLSFIILRTPDSLVRSIGAYFSPAVPPDLFILTHTEFLLFDFLKLPLAVQPANNTCADSKERYHECVEVARRFPGLGHGVNASSAGALTHAGDLLSNADARHATVVSVGCASLIATALDLLLGVDHILLLEDDQTLQTMNRVARWTPSQGNLSFQRMEDLTGYKTLRLASSSTDPWKKNIVAAYNSSANRSRARRANKCSLAVYEQIRLKYGTISGHFA